jgi:hypothetical protein
MRKWRNAGVASGQLMVVGGGVWLVVVAVVCTPILLSFLKNRLNFINFQTFSISHKLSNIFIFNHNICILLINTMFIKSLTLVYSTFVDRILSLTFHLANIVRISLKNVFAVVANQNVRLLTE